MLAVVKSVSVTCTKSYRKSLNLSMYEVSCFQGIIAKPSGKIPHMPYVSTTCIFSGCQGTCKTLTLLFFSFRKWNRLSQSTSCSDTVGSSLSGQGLLGSLLHHRFSVLTHLCNAVTQAIYNSNIYYRLRISTKKTAQNDVLDSVRTNPQ